MINKFSEHLKITKKKRRKKRKTKSTPTNKLTITFHKLPNIAKYVKSGQIPYKERRKRKITENLRSPRGNLLCEILVLESNIRPHFDLLDPLIKL
jgi:hypothetical protein